MYLRLCKRFRKYHIIMLHGYRKIGNRVRTSCTLAQMLYLLGYYDYDAILSEIHIFFFLIINLIPTLIKILLKKKRLDKYKIFNCKLSWICFKVCNYFIDYNFQNCKYVFEISNQFYVCRKFKIPEIVWILILEKKELYNIINLQLVYSYNI